MEVTTHSEDPRIARIHYLDYKKRVQVHREARRRRLTEIAKQNRSALYYARREKDQLTLEDEELMAMYKAMSQGKRVLTLAEVFSETGVDADNDDLPNLAIARADWEWVHFGMKNSNEPFFSSRSSSWGRTKQDTIELPTEFFPANTTNTHWRRQHNKTSYPVKAMVPKIPARLRPDRLDKYWILFEAEWDKCPPVDPILLSRLNLYTFSVVAEWDLTPLERSVLHGRPQ